MVGLLTKGSRNSTNNIMHVEGSVAAAVPAAVDNISGTLDNVSPKHTVKSEKESHSSGVSVDINDLLEEAEHNGSAILLRRPDRISISYHSPIQTKDEKLGDGTAAHHSLLSELKVRNTPSGRVIIDSMHKGRDDNDSNTNNDKYYTNPCSLLNGSTHKSTYFDVGDVIEYACSVDCSEVRHIDKVSNIDDDDDDEGAKGIYDDSRNTSEKDIHVPTESDSNISELHEMMQESCKAGLATTVCVSTTKTANNPIQLCQAVVLLPKGNNSNDIDIGITFCMQDDRLTIKDISKDKKDLFSSPGCAIKEGHTVIGIDNFITSMLTVEDVTSLIQSILSSRESTQLSITTIATTAKPTRWDQVRKAAVAAGGVTMVASGTVLMVTPLHPVGHALALGGVGVLGMEFEAPRKLASSAKERFKSGWLRKGSIGMQPKREDGCQEEEKKGG